MSALRSKENLSTGGPCVTVHCSMYMFPTSSAPQATSVATLSIPPCVRGQHHVRSVSHGGAVNSVPRPSALKNSRGHQRALSQGQVPPGSSVSKPGHSRCESRTNFDLPPDHKDTETNFRSADKGHSRQASRSESIYTIRRTELPSIWGRLMGVFQKSNKSGVDEGRYRKIVPNHNVPPKTPPKDHPNGKRVNNKIRTTKYTLLSFLPRNLLEQFHRVANLYFIIIVLLNWLPAINAFGKEIAMIPVLFVLGVTAVKDLFEDRRRHANDKRINNLMCRVYNSEEGRYRRVLWKNLRVGDLVHLSNNEMVPADIVMLRSSDTHGLCYIDTSHLDGETNLKMRQVVRGFVEKQSSFEPHRFRSILEVDVPTSKISRFNGLMIHPNEDKVILQPDNLLLRESTLKNTDFIEGIVVYAGHETKALLNNGGPRYKRSSLEKRTNCDILWCVVILVMLCSIGAVGCKLWLSAFHDLSAVPFIPYSRSPGYEACLSFLTFLIILQIMIPLSLYVTIELSKLIQVYHINNDVELFDETQNKRIECRALNITEELGQIQYIFSDKTGTLTENKMIFRHCCVNGVDYDHPDIKKNCKVKSGMSIPILPNELLQKELERLSEASDGLSHVHADRLQEFLLVLALCNTVIVPHHVHRDIMDSSGVIDTDLVSLENNEESVTVDTTNAIVNDRYSRLSESRSITPSPSPTLAESQFKEPVKNDTTARPMTPSHSKGNLLNLPSLFANCRRSDSIVSNNAMPSLASSSSTDGPIFEAESPDELALVNAAYIYDCKLLKRTPYFAMVSLFGTEMTYEILHLLPFDSTRKCMSVIFRHPVTREIILYSKGADSVILAKLARVSDDEMNDSIYKTQQLLNNYARQGLRVLVMAKRTLTEAEYIQWKTRQDEYERTNDNREKKICENYSRIESNLTLVGATGIEDRLQEGVPKTLSALSAAGITVWVLTGDKPETAINIAYSAKLFSPQMEILKLMTSTKTAAENTIKFHLDDINSADSKRVQKERALVVDGKTLTFILDRYSNLTEPFLRLTRHYSSVLCCRATPLQKSYIVKVVKEVLKMKTLAVGDGANDVSMIQTADVGIGISGQEGMQAVMAADFTLSRFKFLERLLLVHGHWCYDRLARMILYFFYKNAAFVFVIFWYQLFCGFSGAVMIDQMYLMLYNLVFTSLQPIVIGVYDQDAPEHILTSEPYLYNQGRLSLVYKPHSFWIVMADALYQSVVIYFIAQATYYDSDVGIWEFGTVITASSLVTMLIHAIIETRCWTILQVMSFICSIGGFFVFAFLYNALTIQIMGLPNTYWIIQYCMATYTFWLVILLTCVLALLPRLITRVLRTILCPDDVTSAILYQRSRSVQETSVTGIKINF